MKLALEKEKDLRGGNKVPWVSCQPFVENSRAVLIHRPRRVTTHKIGPKWAAHISVHAWCGNSMSGSKKFTFLDAPAPERIVCARCEANAVANGLPASSALAGRHVHLGGVVAIAHCCPGVTQEQAR
jgi:hypothetical protein